MMCLNEPRFTGGGDPLSREKSMTISAQEQEQLEVYKALRSEIDRRSNTQQAIVGAELVAATTLTSVALSRPNNVGVLLIIPAVSLFLAMQWYDHRLAIRSLGSYIGAMPDPLSAWENKGKSASWGKHLGLLAPLSLFPAVSLGAILALLISGLHRNRNPLWAIVWWAIDVAALLVQIGMVKHLSGDTGSKPKKSAGSPPHPAPSSASPTGPS